MAVIGGTWGKHLLPRGWFGFSVARSIPFLPDKPTLSEMRSFLQGQLGEQTEQMLTAVLPV
jgi:hypothetical protein